MVSTRHHPRPFPDPSSANSTSSQNGGTDSPTKFGSSHSNGTVLASSSPQKHRAGRNSSNRPFASSSGSYRHTPPPLLVLWLLVSLPLVCWDSGYIFLRPHSMEGGKFHVPVWRPYALYATIDYVYGWPALNNKLGFTAAQGALNIIETVMYLYYLTMLYKNGRKGVFSFWDVDRFWRRPEENFVDGVEMAGATLVCFSAAIMTLSKTLLYWLNEYFSGFSNIGHNSLANLFWLWILPNGLWLIFPVYMMYVLGPEITAAMTGSGLEKTE